MKGHPPLPDPHEDEGIGDEAGEVVEEHVADAPPQHRAEREVEHEVVDLLRLPSPPGFPRGAAPAKPPADPDPDDVGEAVPADRHRSDRDGHGVDIGKAEHVGRAAVGSSGSLSIAPR